MNCGMVNCKNGLLMPQTYNQLVYGQETKPQKDNSKKERKE